MKKKQKNCWFNNIILAKKVKDGGHTNKDKKDLGAGAEIDNSPGGILMFLKYEDLEKKMILNLE